MTVNLSNKFSLRKILCQIVKDTENVTGSTDRNHLCKSATLPTHKKKSVNR